jgi:hypothetical protein
LKRQANVLSALIQNFDTVEKVIETSANSAGSALKENERYLDSIQGKIDQFNNAMQTIWSNLLDSDVVKAFVEWGTKIIQSLDTVQGKFLAIAKVLAIFMAFKKVNPLDFIKDVSAWMSTIKDGGGLMQYLKSLLGLAPAMKVVTAETIANTVATQMNDAAKAKQMMSDMGLAQVTGTLSAAQKEQAATAILSAMSTGQLTMAQGNAMLAMLGYSGATMAADGSLKVLDITTKSFMATNPVGWILAIVSALMAVVMVVKQLIPSTEDLAQAAKEAMSEYSNATNTLREHHSTIEDIKDDYEELANGVDNLGNNVSLTTEEYERYNEIANQIADMFPQMVAGYTEEGNAILKLKGNVEALKDAYEAEATAARDALLVEADKVVSSNYNASGTIHDHWSGDDFWTSFGKDLGETFSAGLWQATAGPTELGALKTYIQEGGTIDGSGLLESTEISRILQTLKDAGADLSYWEILTGDKNALDRVISENRTIVEAVLGDIDASLAAAARDNRSIMDAYLKNSVQYSDLDDKTKAAINNVVQNLDEEFLTSFKSSTDMYKWILDDLLGGIGNLSGDNKAQFDAMFDLQTKFNSGDVRVEEYLTQLSALQELLRTLGVDEEVVKSVSLLFNTDGLDAKQNVAKDFLLDEFDANVGQLKKTDLDIVDKYAKEFEEDMSGVGYTWDAFIAKINEKKLIDAFSPQDFEKVSNGLDAIQNAYNSLSDAVEQYNNTGYLTLDSLQSILSLEPEYLALLQMENGQLSINQAAAEAMIQAKLAEAEANAIQSAMTQLETLAKEAATKATNDNATAATNAITSLGNYSSALGTIAQDAIVAAGAVSALNNAVDGAKEAGVSEEDINAVMSNLDTYLSLINTTRQNLSTSFVPIVTGGTGGNPEKDQKDTEIEDGWEALVNKYENKLALITNERDRVQAEIDKAEARGGQASKEMYDDLIRLELEERQLLKEKKAELEEYLRVHNDSIDPETWTEYNNEINATAIAIEECTSNIYNFAQSLKEIDMHYFEQATDEISRLADEIDFVMSLFEDEDMFDEVGNWTEAGITKINLMRDQMTTYASLAKMWGDRLTELQNMQKGTNGLYAFDKDTKNAIAADFQSMFDSGKIDKTTYDEYMQQLNDAWSAGGFSEEIYNEWVNEAEDGMRDAISAQKDVRDEMLDMWDAYIDKIEEGIQKEIEAYEDLIDVQKEELDAARELYDFRKQVANDSKDISELERRIASLSGSTAASDIAERRKLQAQLRDKQSELDDRYYDHAYDARSNALDDEVNAFAVAKNRYVENMREAAKDTEWVINEMITNGIFNADVANDFLLRIQETYNIPLSKELTDPWAAAADRAVEFKNKVGIIAGTDIPSYVTMISDDIRNKLATNDANNPWNQAIAMADKYADFLTDNEFSLANKDMTTFEGQINSIISKWKDVKTAADEAYSAQTRTATVGGNENAGKVPEVTEYYNDPSLTQKTPEKQEVPKKTPTPTRPASPTRPEFTRAANNTGLNIGEVTYSASEFNALQIEGKDGIYFPYTAWGNKDKYVKKTEGYDVTRQGSQYKIDFHSWQPLYTKHAKGTTGTTRDEWAITDEPQFGDELVLVPGKDGNLSFMRKGTGVVPADMTQKLFELAQIPTSDLMNKNLTAIVPNITKNDFKNEFNFESLVHVDTVDSDTLPKLEKMVDKKIDDFSKALNYSLKRFAR